MPWGGGKVGRPKKKAAVSHEDTRANILGYISGAAAPVSHVDIQSYLRKCGITLHYMSIVQYLKHMKYVGKIEQNVEGKYYIPRVPVTA